jgi:hypothetical protein
MKKGALFIIILLTCLNLASAQTGVDSVYLLRKPDKQRDLVRIPSTGAYFIQKAGLKPSHFGWQSTGEFVASDSNMLYFEMESTEVPDGPWNDYTGGSFQLVIDLPPGITELNLDTVGRLGYHLINNYAERESSKGADNQLSGLLSFQYGVDKEVVISGVIDIKTARPHETHQQVVYRDVAVPVMGLAEHVEAEMEKQARRFRQEDAVEALASAKAYAKKVFFDSLFTKDMAKRSALTGLWNGKGHFAYALSGSYILTDAALGRRPEGSLMDMLGANYLGVKAGWNKVFLLHAFYDPDPLVTDDEFNFSLGIEVDSLVPGKTYSFFKKAETPAAVLGYWHYGPAGRPILSEKVEGTVTVLADSSGVVSGKMDLMFYYKKGTFRIYGDYLLPTVSLETVTHFREQLDLKYGDK